MRSVAAAFLAFGLAGAAPAADVQLKVRNGQMAIEAVNVSLRDVIDRVASRTGMRVIYDGNPPEQLVKVSLTERSTADAVVGILEGRGINFALILKPGGTQVQTLLVSTVKPPPRAPVMSDEEGGIPQGAGEEQPPMPPPPPPPPDAQTSPDDVAAALPVANQPPAAQKTPTPVPATLPTPNPPSVSPFTPQGPGPIILPIAGSTPPPS